MAVTVHVANAFIDGGRGGNPAGLVIDADALSAAQKQAVAARAGFSETAFVSRSGTADFKLEFFTPTRQIAHCGHATIAAFAVLKQKGRIPGQRSSKETIDGRREIFFEGEAAFMEQRAPRYAALPAAGVSCEDVLGLLGLSGGDLIAGQEPLVVNTGNSFMIVPVKTAARVGAVRPRHHEIARISEALDLIGCYVFSLETGTPGRHAGARMFAPRFGIDEESATGMAAGPLACFLRDRLGLAGSEFLIEQGVLMPKPSPSLLTARLEFADGKIARLLVGGRAAISKSLAIDA